MPDAKNKKSAPRSGAKASEVGADGVTLFSRRQAAGLLGVSVSALRQWHAQGRLVADHQRAGVHIYTRQQLERWQQMQDPGKGELASKVFAELEGGRTPVQIVIELKAEPEEVRRLVDCYTRLTGGWLVQGPPGPRRTWEESYQLGPLTPAKLRRALELCAANEALRSKLLQDG